METVVDLAETLNANIDLLYVNTPSNFTDTETAEARMQHFIPSRSNVKFSATIYDDFDMERGVLRFIKEKKPQLITMVTHRREFKPAYMVSSTDTILFRSEIPVLSMVMTNKTVKDKTYEKHTRTI
jgi:hypothetical protein